MDIKALLKTNRQRRHRRQTGTVVKRGDGFWLRFYTDNARGQRVKTSERLCGLDASASTVKQKRKLRMAAINAQPLQDRAAGASDLTVGAFFTETYLPWAKENLRWSTVRGYEQLWAQVLKVELETRVLDSYRTVDGSRFLTSLTSRLGRNALAHARSLASGIFTHALNLGLIETNPWHDVKVLAKVRAPRPKVAYSVAETNAILKAIPRKDAKLLFALCAVLGMRPSEAAAMRWENIEKTQLHVRLAAPYGHAGETKTEQSKRSLPLIEPVKSLVAAWRKECGGVTEGWLFTRPNGHPIDHTSFVARNIAPLAKVACARYCGLYSGRHGAATVLFELTGDARAANQVLGNSLPVVMKTYVKPSTEAGEAGLKALERALRS
jgi:integrase